MKAAVPGRATQSRRADPSAPRIVRALAVLLLFGALAAPARATSIVMLITREGIAIGADEKITHGRDDSAPPPSLRPKITVVDNRIAVARSGIETLGMRGAPPVWNFDAFIRTMEANIPRNTPVPDFADHVRRGLIQTFSGFDAALASGAVTREMLGPQGMVFIKLFITGYDADTPRAYSLQVSVDWARLTHTIPPVQSLYPDGRKNVSILWSSWSPVRGLVELRDRSSGVHNQLQKQMPQQLDALENDRRLPWMDVPALIRNLLTIEVTRNPEGVGYPLQIVAIPREGTLSNTTYSR